MLFKTFAPIAALCGAAAALPWSPATDLDTPSFAPISSGSSLGSLQLPVSLPSPSSDVRSAESASLSYWAQVWSPFSSKPIPLIIWHGLGDSAFSPNLAELKTSLEEAYPGLYVHLIPLGASQSEDRNRGVFGNVVEDVAQVCEDLQHVEELSSGGVMEVDAMGFSQGGQFLRALVQTCEPLKVRNLVTLGSQHMGISDFPACSSADFLCRLAEGALRSGVFTEYAQTHIVSAQYYRDPQDAAAYQRYLAANKFLTDINNEVSVNEMYKKRLASLDSFVMLQFSQDKTVVPKRSSWFESYAIANETDALWQASEGDGEPETIPLRQSDIYLEDRVGLKTLDKRGSLVLDVCKGAHMQIDQACQLKIFGKYVGTPKSAPLLRSFPTVRHAWYAFLYRIWGIQGAVSLPWMAQLGWLGLSFAIGRVLLAVLVWAGSTSSGLISTRLAARKTGKIQLP